MRSLAQPHVEIAAPDWALDLKAGDVVVHVTRRTLRVVMVVGHRPPVVAFRKVGRSWTDPNPWAWYDLNVLCDYERTCAVATLTEEERAMLAKGYRHQPHNST